MIKHIVCLAAACAFLPILAGHGRAAVLRVPSEYATINAALDASVAGDSVLVAPGVYDEYETRLIAGQFWFSCVGFLRDDVSLVSETGAGSTTLRMDTTTADPGLLLGWGGSGRTEVIGFTLTGSVPGLNAAGQGYGGTLVFRDCVLRDIGSGSSSENALSTIQAGLEVYGCRFENINGGSGSAIYQTSGTLVVEDSEFLNCRSGAIGAGYDPGFPHATGLTVRRCRFVGNVQTNGAGGAVSVGSYGQGLIEDCWFQENWSNSTGGAVSAFGSASSYTVRNCVFIGNTVHGTGAAIYSNGNPVVIEGNTFVDSETTRPQVFAGAVTILGSGARTVVRNVSVNSIGDPAFYIESAANLTEGCNVFWSNPGGNTQGFTPSPSDLEADPLFCDSAGGDFRVSAGSPCLPGNGHPSCTEAIGALGEGCGTIAVTPETWGKIKGQYRGEGDGR